MAKTSRQTSIFGLEDWQRIYQTYREADFQSYDFETLRKSFVDYIRLYYPESYNDYIESSEFVALLDIIAFMGQSLSFRNDLNTRENFIDTAERRDSVVRLADLVGYSPKRNEAATGYLKVTSVRTTENVLDFNGDTLSNATIVWNDTTNPNWLEQFNVVINAALVSSQKVGKPGITQVIGGVKTDEYTMSTARGFLPVIPFTSKVNGYSMNFEAVSVTSKNKNYMYEPTPKPNGEMNVLYRNDKLGYASPDTGFFFYFKQGSLVNYDFNLQERIANRTVPVENEGVNQSDVWLYKLNSNNDIAEEWEQVESVYASSAQQTLVADRKFYSVTSRANDAINLNFGDGVFSVIPVGKFRAYVRTSNGLQYVINPEDMQNIQFGISYISRSGRNETLTFTCSLQQPVSNAAPRETINEIKGRAPAKFYTQNRMVNGEDYSNMPYALFGSIVKSKAVNRTSVGTSRYLDFADVTGKYSATNIFGSDGILYESETTPVFNFSFVDVNDITDVIINRVEPILEGRGLREFYYKHFTRPDLSGNDLTWTLVSAINNEAIGYFNYAGLNVRIGPDAPDQSRKYLVPGTLIKFQKPSGEVDWATIVSVVNSGLTGATFPAPVTLNNPVPTGSAILEVIPTFVSDLELETEQEVRSLVELYRDFGLSYDHITRTWQIIPASRLSSNSAFDITSSGELNDSSWLIKFETDGVNYTVTYRSLERFFASLQETRFYYDGRQKVYDPKTGKIVNDFINVLKTNSAPNSNHPLGLDYKLDIIDQPTETDGFSNDYRVRVSFKDSDSDGVPDDPDYFTSIVDPTTNPNQKRVFMQKVTDFSNLERVLPLPYGTVETAFATVKDIEQVTNNYVAGQLFYAYDENLFYTISYDQSNKKIVTGVDDVEYVTGRQDLYFQYRHNAPLSSSIDPSTTNIIDVYLVTSSYYTAYQNYILDNTNTITEPVAPNIDELSVAYSDLNKYKMISDNLVLNSVKFKPLFGPKADPALRAKFKVIRSNHTTVSASEIKSRMVAAMNRYFTLDNWDFGSTFYFSELTAYLHKELGDIISTVVIIPDDPDKEFGSLFEIRSRAHEIFVNAATVNDIIVIDALTSSQLRTATNSGAQ